MNVSIDSIRARLLLHKGSYPEIGRRAAVSYSWLTKFATGERGRRPSFELVTRLARVLDEMDAEQATLS